MRHLLFLLTLAPFSLMAANFHVKNTREFNAIVPANARLEKLASGMQFVEGPVYVPAQKAVIFSDIPKNQLKKWAPEPGLSTFREPSNNANGNTLDKKGRLITAEHGARRISITLENGQVETVVDRFEGKRLNSPNDVVVHRDGTIWFTDPDYGIQPNQKELSSNNVYRFNPKDRTIVSVVPDQPFDKPNGLAFSPDYKKLYVADSGAPRHIRVFEVDRRGHLKNGRVFCKIDSGVQDGIRCDSQGRVYSSVGDGIHIFGPNGLLIGKILVPESAANLCFGGKDMKMLYITARTSLYSIPMAVKGTR